MRLQKAEGGIRTNERLATPTVFETALLAPALRSSKPNQDPERTLGNGLGNETRTEIERGAPPPLTP